LPESVAAETQPKFRQFISRCFHFVIELLFWMHIKDHTMPVQLIRSEAMRKIHPTLCIADPRF